MATTYTLIASNTLSSSAASVTFSAIPGTYTDLVLRASIRSTEASTGKAIRIEFNADSSAIYSVTRINGSGSAASSSRRTDYSFIDGYTADADNNTANTYSSLELYLSNYTSTKNKLMSIFHAQENNTTAAEMNAIAGLYGNTSAITSIKLNFASLDIKAGSSFFLYGIKNS